MCEEVRGILGRWDVRHLDFECLHHVSNEEVSAFDVLHTAVVLWIVRDISSAATVCMQWSRTRLFRPKTTHKLAQVDYVFRRL